MDDLEGRLEELEDRVSALEGAEPTTFGEGGVPFTLERARKEIELVWQCFKDLRAQIAQLEARLSAGNHPLPRKPSEGG